MTSAKKLAERIVRELYQDWKMAPYDKESYAVEAWAPRIRELLLRWRKESA